eukprot:Hpha_TRINITY_DN33788_c0_g1::TRINITY_DN33788_c0_g1_i1::g.24953::m.24953
MCIFCERAKADLASADDPFGLPPIEPGGGSRGGGYASGSQSTVPLAARAAAEQCTQLRARRVPCTLVTGFLGSGKTTLVNHLLRGTHGRKLAVLENEAGDVAVDHDLLPQGADRMDAPEVILLPNGCVCCKVRGDMIEALKRVADREGIDGIIIELSGLADIAPVAQTFFASDWAQSRLTLDAVVCVCDAGRCAQLLVRGEESPAKGEQELIRSQLQLADRIVVNKVDTLTGGYEELAEVEKAVQGVSPAAVVVSCCKGEVSPDKLLGTAAFSLAASLETHSPLASLLEGKHLHHHHQTFGYAARGAVEGSGPLDWGKFKFWLGDFLQKHPDAAVRFKGVLWCQGGPFSRDSRGVLQGVAGHADFTEGRRWEPGATRSSKIVFIGKVPEGFSE